MCADQKEYEALEMARLISSKPNVWFLLEVLELNESGRASKMKLLKFAKDKDVLYDFLMDDLEDWDWKKKIIFVFSDPTKKCDLL